MDILQKKPVYAVVKETVQEDPCETDYCKELEKLDVEFNKMIRSRVKKKQLKDFIQKKIDIINEMDDY